jgi:hypothetical protein
MVNALIETINVILFGGASILMLLWQKEIDQLCRKLIKNIGITIGIIGAYKLTSLIMFLCGTDVSISAFSSVIELFGFGFLMLSLFSYLEGKR